MAGSWAGIAGGVGCDTSEMSERRIDCSSSSPGAEGASAGACACSPPLIASYTMRSTCGRKRFEMCREPSWVFEYYCCELCKH
eukprot:6174881-Pleurochrysis_carterae.AAC.3